MDGKTLACHCHPLPCHGDVLAKAAAWAHARIAPCLAQPVLQALRVRHTPAPIYAGVGARRAPPASLASMWNMARELAARGWHLRTGGAAGADSAFAHAAPPRRPGGTQATARAALGAPQGRRAAAQGAIRELRYEQVARLETCSVNYWSYRLCLTPGVLPIAPCSSTTATALGEMANIT